MEKEQIIFRIIQELVNNILKHSNASFIHVTQNTNGNKFFIRMHHDGRGLTQADFEKDMSQTYYKVTIELSKEEEEIDA